MINTNVNIYGLILDISFICGIIITFYLATYDKINGYQIAYLILYTSIIKTWA